MRMWVYNPHTGGKSIPPEVKHRTERRILDYAAKRHTGKFTRIEVRFSAQAAGRGVKRRRNSADLAAPVESVR
jgi:hypothetical protein